MTTALKLSKDRKVTNAVNKSGKQALIANTFGLPSGKNYSCGGATEVCETICYAGKLEKLFPSVSKNLLHNWELLKDADYATTVELLSEIIAQFHADTVKRGAEKIFRIHWDGDFFSTDYMSAWIEIIRNYGDVQFWVYTREAFAAVGLHKAELPNLSLYYSTDTANLPIATMLRKTYGIRLAMLANNFQEGQAIMREITGKVGAKCPENNKASAFALINTEGSACARCRLCVKGKADIVFSASKK
jgi:hypothetical protein